MAKVPGYVVEIQQAPLLIRAENLGVDIYLVWSYNIDTETTEGANKWLIYETY